MTKITRYIIKYVLGKEVAQLTESLSRLDKMSIYRPELELQLKNTVKALEECE